MDADLQDPPELIPQMVDLYRRGFDVVQARRASREKESLFKRVTAWAFYRIMGTLTNHEMEANVGEFRLMSRAVVEALGQLREHHRLVRGLVSWVGFSHTTLDYVRPGRAAGETKYPLLKMLRLSADGLTSFSTAPLRIASLLGLCGLLGGLAYAAYAVYVRFVLGGGPGMDLAGDRQCLLFQHRSGVSGFRGRVRRPDIRGGQAQAALFGPAQDRRCSRAAQGVNKMPP